MGYTVEEIKVGKVEFKYAHWDHPLVKKKTFTEEDFKKQKGYLKEGDVVIDIGAFSGDTPVLYAHAVGKTGKVIAFEPNPHAFEVLKANAELNSQWNIFPVKAAVTETDGSYTFHYSDDKFCNGGYAEKLDKGIGATGHVVPLDVLGVNLESWAEANLGNDIEKIRFIKIDTEGYDFYILKSIKNLVKTVKPLLEVELYPELSERELNEFYDIIDELGYFCFKQNSDRNCALNSLHQPMNRDTFMKLAKDIGSGNDVVCVHRDEWMEFSDKETKTTIIENDLNLTKMLDSIPEDFNFLFVGHWLKGKVGDDRKDVGMLIKTFCTTFANRNNGPGLIMKSSGAGFSIMDRERILNKITEIKKSMGGDNHPNVYLIHGDLTDEEMNTLYNHPKIKAHISFTHGEGFGRPLLEATLSGKPVIAPNWSGHVDFLGDGAVLLEGELSQVPESSADKFLMRETKWFTINYSKAAAKLDDIFNNYKKYLPAASKLAKVNRDKFSLNRMYTEFKDILTRYVKIQQEIEIKLPKLRKQDAPQITLPKLSMKSDIVQI